MSRRVSLRGQLRRTLMIAFGAALVVTAGGLVRVWGTLEAVRTGFRRLELLPQIRENLSAMKLSEDHLTGGDAAELGRFHEQSDQLEADITKLSGLTGDPSRRSELERLVTTARDYRRHVDEEIDVLSGKRHFDDPAWFRQLQSAKRLSLATMESAGTQLLAREMERTSALLRGSFTDLVAALLAVVTVALFGLLLIWRTGRRLVERVTRLAASTRNIASGPRVDRRLAVDSGDELGDLATAFNALLAARQGIVDQLVALVKEQGGTTDRIDDAAREVTAGAEKQFAEATSAAAVVNRVVGRLREIAKDVSASANDSRECTRAAKSILETSAVMAEQAGHAASAVDETSRATEGLSRTIAAVAARTEVLSESARTTAAAMSDASTATVRMRASAADAARISDEVSVAAATGAEAVHQAIVGVARIHDETELVVAAISDLVEKVARIGDAVGVIEEVADQTKLLALNASILAASAGEAGAGFAVVGDSIKELAARTRNSTNEIASILGAAEVAAEGARAASGRIATAVSEGVDRSRVAEEALSAILGGVRIARAATSQIAPAAAEQSGSADRVAAAMEGVVSSVEVIAKAANEQADEVRRIHHNMERMRDVVLLVRKQSDEQQAAARRVASTVEAAAKRMVSVERAHTEQSGANEELQLLMRSIAEVTERYRSVAKTLQQSTTELAGGALRLLDQTRRLESTDRDQ